ncbi:hypothetical protein LDENG_00207140 [Lucifuga dentata]|nr:hypothetical protein LDENG_00207140 [Lucifuga dentata]
MTTHIFLRRTARISANGDRDEDMVMQGLGPALDCISTSDGNVSEDDWEPEAKTKRGHSLDSTPAATHLQTLWQRDLLHRKISAWGAIRPNSGLVSENTAKCIVSECSQGQHNELAKCRKDKPLTQKALREMLILELTAAGSTAVPAPANHRPRFLKGDSTAGGRKLRCAIVSDPNTGLFQRLA